MIAGTPDEMRVLKAVQSYFPFQDRGGPVVKVRALAHGLVERGHQVTVLTADLGLARHEAFDASFEPCKWGWRAQENGVEAVYLSTLANYRALTLNPDVIGFCGASLRQFDLVHFYGLYDLFGPAVSYFCRRQGLPYVIEPMGMYRPIDRSFQLKRVWHRGLGRPQGLAVARDGSLYVAASLHGRRGVVRVTATGEANLVLAGTNIVGLAFSPLGSVVLATNQAVYDVDLGVEGQNLF